MAACCRMARERACHRGLDVESAGRGTSDGVGASGKPGSGDNSCGDCSCIARARAGIRGLGVTTNMPRFVSTTGGDNDLGVALSVLQAPAPRLSFLAATEAEAEATSATVRAMALLSPCWMLKYRCNKDN